MSDKTTRKRYLILEEINFLEDLYNCLNPDNKIICSERIDELYSYLNDLDLGLS